MRNYSLKTKGNSHHKSNWRRVLIGFLVAGVIVVFLFIGRSASSEKASFLMRPLYATRTFLTHTIAFVPDFFKTKASLHREIETQRNIIDSHRGDTDTLMYLENENTELRSFFSLSERPLILAGVIGRPPLLPYDVIVLDKGRTDNVENNAIVFDSAGYAIGSVKETYDNSSLVELFSSPSAKMTVYIFGPNIFVDAYGEGGGIIRISIPQGISVNKGDIVALPSLEHGLIGTITDIVSVSTQPEQHAYIAVNTSLQSLKTVSVSRNPITPVSFETAKSIIEQTRSDLFTIPLPSDYMKATTSSKSATSSIP